MRYLMILILILPALMPTAAEAFRNRCNKPVFDDLDRAARCGVHVPGEFRTPENHTLEEIRDMCYSGQRHRLFHTARGCYNKLADRKMRFTRHAVDPDWKHERYPARDWTQQPERLNPKVASIIITAFVFIFIFAVSFWPHRK